MKRTWAGGLGLSLLLSLPNAQGQEPARSYTSPVILGRPQAVIAPAQPTMPTREAPSALVPVSFNQPGGSSSVSNWQNPAPEFPTPPPVPGGGAPVFPAPGLGTEPYNCGVATQNPGAGHPIKQWFQDLCGAPDSTRKKFSSDHNFDGFISPVTNPFLFEDPRSLTELRPIGMYQKIPSRNLILGGGDIEQFALQGRLAFTENWSLVVHKLGWTWLNPDSTLLGGQQGNGFSELWLGPKFTFLRNEKSNCLGAMGLIFQVPVGSDKVYQDTGTLSLAPYVTFGKSCFKSSYGTLNTMANMGYNFSIDSKRSDYFYANLHLDYDVGNFKRFWPLIELSWFHYTSNGTNVPLTFEGRDLINFGSTMASGRDEVALAGGARFRVNDCWSIGAAAEFPITSKDALLDFRITLDMIFRY